MGRGKVRNAISVKIRGCDSPGRCFCNQASRLLKRAISISKVHPNVPGIVLKKDIVRGGKVESTILIQVRGEDGKRLSPYREGEAYRKVQRGCLFALVGNPVPVAIFAPAACYVHGVRKSVLVAIRLAFIWNAVVVLVWLSA